MNYKCKYIKETFNTCAERDARVLELEANPNMRIVTKGWGKHQFSVTYQMVRIEEAFICLCIQGELCPAILNDLKNNFCDIWQPYAPRLCQWIMDKTFECAAALHEGEALFADDIERANRLYKLEERKKEIQDVRNNFFA